MSMNSSTIYVSDQTPALTAVQTPLVSVVIPTHNYSGFVTEAVESVLSQTYTNIDLIVVDDGSTDDTRERLALFGDRVRYIYQENSGPSAARNTGIRAAKGEYIAFLDADDLFHPRKLEIQVRYLLDHPDIALVAAENLTDQNRVFPDFPPNPFLADRISLESAVVKNRFGMCGVVVRRHCFNEVGLFNEELRSTEDRDMWVRIIARFPVAKLRARLWWYRFHPASVTRTDTALEQNESRALDRLFAMPVLANRPLLERRARSAAAFSAAMMYRYNGQHWQATIRAIRSIWLWPVPHSREDIRPLERLKFLLLMPRYFLRRQPQARSALGGEA
jgi:glycosyltransferase involved in cell wall biosynthesis